MPKTFVVELPCLEHSATGHAAHLVEMLRNANLLADLRLGRRAPRFGWRWVDGQGRSLPQFPYAAEGAATDGPAQALFLSALHRPDIPSIREIVAAHPALVRRLATAFDQGLAVCTLGSAAWFAAASGRCQGRRVALPWYFMGGFGLDFPGIALAEGQPFVDDRPWLSASHPEALAPMAVALTRHAFGDDLAAALAAVLQPDPERERTTHAALRDRRIPATRTSWPMPSPGWRRAWSSPMTCLPWPMRSRPARARCCATSSRSWATARWTTCTACAARGPGCCWRSRWRACLPWRWPAGMGMPRHSGGCSCAMWGWRLPPIGKGMR